MIRTFFDLSTAHLRPETMQQLSDLTPEQRMGNGWPAMTVSDYLHGVFLTVPDFGQPLDNLPDDLGAVLAHARSYGVTALHVHSDGIEVSDLDIYSW